VNHLDAHALSARLQHPSLTFPYAVLLVSGGHCQLMITRGPGAHRVLGQTTDDSVGEAFDKTARLLRLRNGAALEQAALRGAFTSHCRFCDTIC